MPPTTPPPSTAATGQDPDAPVDVTALPPNVQKLIQELRTESGKHRTEKSAAQQQLADVMKALGRNPDGTELADPAASAAEAVARAEQAEARAWTAAVQLHVHNLAQALGANPDGLLNSESFIDSLDDLVDADMSAPQFRTALEAAMKAELERHPYLKAAAAAPGRVGAEINGGAGSGGARPTSLSAAVGNAYRRS